MDMHRDVRMNMYIPETVQRPAILWPYGRTGVPELGLEELSSGIDEAAAVRGDGCVVAGHRPIDGAAGSTGEVVCLGGRRWSCRGVGGGAPAAQRDLGEEATGERGDRWDVNHVGGYLYGRWERREFCTWCDLFQ